MSTYNTVSSSSASSASSLTYSHNIGSTANRSLVVTVGIASRTLTVTGVTYGGAAMTQLGSIAGASGSDVSQYIFGLATTLTGANNVVASLSGSTEIYSGATSATDADQSSGSAAFGTAATAMGTTAAITVDVTSATNELVVDGVIVKSDYSATGTGQTRRWYLNPNPTTSGWGGTEAGASTVTMSWTQTGSGQAFAQAAVSIKTFTGGGGGPTVTYPMLERGFRGSSRGVSVGVG